MRAFNVSWVRGHVLVALDPLAPDWLVTSASRAGACATVVGKVFGGQAGQTAAEALVGLVSPEGVLTDLPNGDFAGVVCTPYGSFLFRDVQARVPFFMRLHAGRVVEAGTSLLRLASARRPDCHYLCHYLVGVDAGQQHVSRTPFADVERVLAGQIVEVSPTGEIVRRRKATAHAAPVCSDEHTAAVELRHVLHTAVANRLARSVACHLSGGLDSTSVALLAAAELRRSGEGELALVTARYRSGELAGEADYIDAAVSAVRKLYPATRTLTVTADDVVDFDEFEAFSATTDEPYAHAFRAPILSRLSEAAADGGCSAVLTGCGADPVVDGTPLGFLHLVRSGHAAAAVRESDRWAEQAGVSRRKVIVDSAVRPIMPLFVDRLQRTTHRHGLLTGLGFYARPSWVRAGFARDYGYASASRAEARFRLGPDPEKSLFASATFTSAPDALSWAEAGARGFLLSHPFLDRDIVALVASLPHTVRSAPYKPLLRAAMRDLLPTGVLARVHKVAFSAVYRDGLLRNSSRLIGLCQSASNSLVREMFDVDLLCRGIEEATLGAGDAIATLRLNASLTLLVWLEANG